MQGRGYSRQREGTSIVGEFWTALGAISALVAAAAASFAGAFTYRIMKAGQKQVELSRIQNQQTLESERDAQLPVLMPIAPISSRGRSVQDQMGAFSQYTTDGYDRNQPLAYVALHNVGPGIALNVCGVLFEPLPDNETQRTTGQHHFHRYDLPFTSGFEIRGEWNGMGLPFVGDAKLDKEQQYTLYAPPTPSVGNLFLGATQINARLTLTYSDIFGRKHAAIYDLTAQWEWVSVAYLRNIPKDLGDIVHDAMKNTPVLVSPGLPTLG